MVEGDEVDRRSERRRLMFYDCGLYGPIAYLPFTALVAVLLLVSD